MSDWDWETPDFGVQASVAQDLVPPPKTLLFISWGILLMSLISFLISSKLGYGLAVVASIVGGFVVFNDLKRKSDPNYSSLNWFDQTARFTRYAIFGATLLHILRLAIQSSR